jgi:CheY-like chemotaxis protein
MSSRSPASPGPSSADKTALAHLRHELRTPLNAIIGYSEIILEAAADVMPEVREGLRLIQKCGTLLLQLVSDGLDPSRLADDPFEDRAILLCEGMVVHLATALKQTQSLIAGAERLGITGCLEDLKRISGAGERLHEELTNLQRRCQLGKELPRGEETPPQPDPGPLAADEMSPPLAPTPPRPDAASGRILVVDDDELNRDVLSRRLQGMGHQVTVAASAQAALALLRAQPFDLILLDIMMPGMNGLELLRYLKADLLLWPIPVVMISALDDMESIIRCIESGAEDFLPKPCELALLRVRVGASLEKKWLRDREVGYLKQIEAERNRADGLLRAILPLQVVQELKMTNEVEPRRFENIAILFADVVGFTSYCDKRQPEEIVADLEQLVLACEEQALAHHLQKIKTIGDSFMAACGLFIPVPNPVLACVRCGLQIMERARRLPTRWELRIGIHCGSVIAGLLGHSQYLFDLWGDAVNTASRMESHGVPGGITLSEAAYQAVAAVCRCECLAALPVKGKGDLKRYLFREFLPAAAEPGQNRGQESGVRGQNSSPDS